MRVLIAGLGAIGQRHARNLRAVLGSEVELWAFRRRRLRHVVTETLSVDATMDVEEELGITAVFDTIERALAVKPDAVFVCTPSACHLEVAQPAAAAGCHLFIEKPISDTLDGVEQIEATVRSQGTVALVGCQWRFHPLVQWLRTLAMDGTAGAILGAEFDYQEFLPDWHPYEDYRQSYAARRDLGGGVILTQIHDYDLAWWLFGDPKSVMASGGHLSDLEIDVEDTVDATLDGRIRVRVRQTFAARPPRRTITVATEGGTIRVDLLASRVDSDVPGLERPATGGYARNRMFVDEIQHFVDCVERTETPLVPLRDGISVLRVALAAKESLRTGASVELSRPQLP